MGVLSFTFGIIICVIGIVCLMYGFYANKNENNVKPQAQYVNPNSIPVENNQAISRV